MVASWWSRAQLGIFVHWTPASVPGWAPPYVPADRLPLAGRPTPLGWTSYAEWYENALRFPGSPVSAHHRATYGTRPYTAFGQDFNDALESWDPAAWARSFRVAGARYAVLVTKHHDGFCLWPSEVRNPHRTGWHTTRDVVGEFAEAARAEGLRFGVYYSGGLDWTFDDRPIGTGADMVSAVPRGSYPAYAAAQMRELIRRYRPDILWNDIAWPGSRADVQRLIEYYRFTVPNGVVNDRLLPRAPLWSALRLPGAKPCTTGGSAARSHRARASCRASPRTTTSAHPNSPATSGRTRTRSPGASTTASATTATRRPMPSSAAPR